MTTSHKLILVRHSQSNPIPSVPPNKWTLSDEGRRRCQLLADRLKHYAPQVLASSAEPKARETADRVGETLNLPVRIVKQLHEHDRTGESFTTHDLFMANVAAFFANPTRLMFGSETAVGAYLRFSGALKSLLKEYENQTVAVIAHGTVNALYISRSLGLPAFEYWRKLDMPSMVVLSLPDHKLIEVIEEIR